MDSATLANKIARLTLDKKAEAVKILDLKELTPITDYFVICTGESDVQIQAIIDHIEEKLGEEKIRVWHKEGIENYNWVLMDFVDVVVHIFLPEVREYYALEKLWGDANITEVTDESETIST